MSAISRVGQQVERALTRLEPLFKEGMILTFVARDPALPGSELVVTRDNIVDLSNALIKLVQEQTP